MHTYHIYLERADSNEGKAHMGWMQAETVSDALDLAAQFYEVPQHDLLALLDDEPTLQRCPYCGQMHEAYQVEQCPRKPKY